MAIYLNNLTFVNLISVFFYFRKKRSNLQSIPKIYFIDSTKSGNFFLNFLNKILKKKIIFESLSFSMLTVREESGELSRFKIAREDLFNFNHKIVSSEIYKKLISNTSSLQEFYIQKEILDGTIMDEGSACKNLYLLSVISKHLRDSDLSRGYFFLENAPWSFIIKELALEKNIELFSIPSFNLLDYLAQLPRSFPKIYNFLKYLKTIKHSPFNKSINIEKNNLLIDGRGDLILENDGSYSDFFWQLNSSFPKQNIAYLYSNERERKLLLDYGSLPVDGSMTLKDMIFKSHKIKFAEEKKSLENKKFRYIGDKYNNQYMYWHSFFKKNNIKLYLSWFKYDASHVLIKEAINSLGGISAIWQIAFDGIKNFECKTYADLVMSYSSYSLELDQNLDSKIKYNVVTGYPKDYLAQTLKPASIKLRKELLSSGAKYIVSVFDENSGDDERWHTGHHLQRENYSLILEEMLRDEKLGVIFKPKTPLTLRKRLGDVSLLLDKVMETGRCKLLSESGQYTSTTSPTLAALASDLCIHGHLSAGTAALEAVLAGTPTLLIDREMSVHSKLRELPKDKVRFDDWNEAIYAFRRYFKDKAMDKHFGNWESILDLLDPYRDGLGAQRMGNYLHHIIHSMNIGIERDEAMESAAEAFSAKWGSDKIVINRNIY